MSAEAAADAGFAAVMSMDPETRAAWAGWVATLVPLSKAERTRVLRERAAAIAAQDPGLFPAGTAAEAVAVMAACLWPDGASHGA